MLRVLWGSTTDSTKLGTLGRNKGCKLTSIVIKPRKDAVRYAFSTPVPALSNVSEYNIQNLSIQYYAGLFHSHENHQEHLYVMI